MLSSNWPPVTPGGAEAYVAELTAQLRVRGHTVGAVTLAVEGDDVVAALPPRPHRLADQTASPSWKKVLFHAADLWRPTLPRTLRRALAAFQPDVVHSHVVAGMSVGALTAPSRLGAAHVHTVHDYWLRCWRSTLTTRAQRPCGPACALLGRTRLRAVRRHGPHVLIGISRAMLDRHTGLGDRETRVLRHPVAAPAAPRPAPPPRPPTFGYLGQLNPNKGIGVLLEAAADSGALSPSHFVVAGRGRLEAHVAASGVDYRGWVGGSAKEQFFADIDCLVVPSVWQEPAGLVVLEAAVRGVPVIASGIGGLPEYVPTSCRSLLFTPGDPDALLASLKAFCADPAAYAVDPAEVTTWDAHLDAVLTAYGDARRAAA